jgi:hypothetical protein
MLGSFRSNVTVGIAVLVGIAGLSYVLAASAAPPGGTTAAVEFTPDGKLKKPDGYRNWVYVGAVVTPNDLNDGEAASPSSTPSTWTRRASPTTRRPASSATAP